MVQRRLSPDIPAPSIIILTGSKLSYCSGSIVMTIAAERRKSDHHGGIARLRSKGREKDHAMTGDEYSCGYGDV